MANQMQTTKRLLKWENERKKLYVFMFRLKELLLKNICFLAT